MVHSVCVCQMKSGIHLNAFNFNYLHSFFVEPYQYSIYIEGSTDSAEVTVKPVLSGSTKIADTAPSYS